MIQASMAPWRSIFGSTMSRTLAGIAASDQPPSPTTCSSA